ncbi:glycyl-radical enzyme activating protein [Clostridia bacterium]|nr:glycyl-radical enzyme activating protein [Clostridia bacterium]
MDASGIIFDIQRFSIHDGPGIRTTVFMKGCPLRCLWCHNPESWERRTELAYYADKCVSCGRCADICPHGCHIIESGTHTLSRENCTVCGKCAEVCFNSALKLIGREISASEVLGEVRKDAKFYEKSGGGVTLSGGEPLSQPDFAVNILTACKHEGIHTAVETSGYADRDVFARCIEFTDLFLFDIKAADSVKHKRFTGADNVRILDNLYWLDANGTQIILRCPIIPGLNDDSAHFREIANIANSLKNVRQIDVEPYHPLGLSKAEAIGKTPGHCDPNLPNKEITAMWVEEIRSQTDILVVGN